MKKKQNLSKLWSELNHDMWVFDQDGIRAILSSEPDDPHGYKLSIKIKALHGTTTRYYFALDSKQAKELAFKHIDELLEEKTNELKELSKNFYCNILWKAKYS